eukprot:11787068-Prorocentrum_lima.AAC.1
MDHGVSEGLIIPSTQVPLLSKQFQVPSHLRLGVPGLFNQLRLPSSPGLGQTRLSAMPGPSTAKQLASSRWTRIS